MTSTFRICTWLLLSSCVLVTLSDRNSYKDPNGVDPLIQFYDYLMEQGVPSLSPALRWQIYKKMMADKDDLSSILMPVDHDGVYQYNEQVEENKDREKLQIPTRLFYSNNPLDHSNLKPYDPWQADSRGYGDELPSRHFFYKDTSSKKRMKEKLFLEPFASYSGDWQMEKPRGMKFTYKFGHANLTERNPFAVKPNDPRYYQDGPFFLGDSDKSDFEKPVENNTKREREDTLMKKMHSMHEDDPGNVESQFKERSVIVIPQIPFISQDLNNDIYFIAIVAGCSAAAIFAFVLIALTWCRLKRGAKAAADIEYPAYGVTGPNKEVSPSGDQRLAQSAQMYHFQHQKQQIIAMEKDPGSVSEAESEEENEEGDYTVYECPGLASTGEMEVKNPLFHDDPTPATPAASAAQSNKDEDHM